MISQSERQYNWSERDQSEMPGPGNYSDMNAFGNGMRGGYMGTKQETKIQMTPGPADYKNDGKVVQKNA